MQLLLILALILYGGKGGNAKLLNELKPLIESVGGEEVKEAFRNAEELESVISAFGGLVTADGASGGSGDDSRAGSGGISADAGSAAAGHVPGRGEETGDNTGNNFPLAPVAGIADREILYRLVQYFSQNSAGA